MIALVGHDIGVGALLVVWGGGMAAIGYTLGRRPPYFRRAAERRWRVVKYMDWRIRTGRIEREQWLEEDARSQRRLLAYAYAPAGALLLLLGLVILIRGVVAGP